MAEFFPLVDGYDRNKYKRVIYVRRMTLDEIKALGTLGHSHADAITNDGTLRRVKINGAVKRWKREPDRVEVSVKYGMREYARFDTAESLRRFVVPETDAEKLTRVADAAGLGRYEDCECSVCIQLRALGREALHVKVMR